MSKEKNQNISVEFQLNMDQQQSIEQKKQQPSIKKQNSQRRSSNNIITQKQQLNQLSQQTHLETNNDKRQEDEKSSTSSQESQRKLFDDSYGNNEYTTLEDKYNNQEKQNIIKNSKIIRKLQLQIKTQFFLLQYEQKHKNQKIKEIQYSYINAFTNYLWCRTLDPPQNTKVNPIVVTNKDLLQIHDCFVDDLQVIKTVLTTFVFPEQRQNISSDITKLMLSNSNPPNSFLIDFHNFFPNWHNNITAIIQMEVDNSQKIQNIFASQYTFSAKVISALRYKDKIIRFCQKIFDKPLKQLKEIKSELSLDFSSIYQKWLQKINSYDKNALIRLFFQGKQLIQQGNVKVNLRKEIQSLFNQKMQINDYDKLLIQMNHFAKNKEAFFFLERQIGTQEIQNSNINLRLGLLVWKKIQINRRKLQKISVSLINQILENYQKIPQQIKFMVQQFRKIVRAKFQEIKYDDIKNFFNKMIFSLLFFSIFMNLHQEKHFDFNPKKEISYHNLNITTIALITQKIMFGQQFYQKQKYGCFNSTIHEYHPKIKKFIQKFGENQLIKFPSKKQVECFLLSLESIIFLYNCMVQSKNIRRLQSIQEQIQRGKTNTFHLVGSSKYSIQNIYIILISKPVFNYVSIFKPANKYQRTFIDFLQLIQTISETTTFEQVLQHYKCLQEDVQMLRPSIQIYANYLSIFSKQISTQQVVSKIQASIFYTKQCLTEVKINLQRQFNYAQNLQKWYMRFLKQKRQSNSKILVEDLIHCILSMPLGFDYQLIDEKVCESTQIKKQKTVEECLNDIAKFFVNKNQGVDGLYHMLLEKVIQQVQNQGIVDQNMIKRKAFQYVETLLSRLNLTEMIEERDKKVFAKMRRHSFLNCKLLQIGQYSDEQELIIDICLPLLKNLKKPSCPDTMLKIFHDVTLTFQNIILITGKASDITADVQIPLMILVLIKSELRNLPTYIRFIQAFCHQDTNSNKYGQTLTLVKSVQYLIEEMSNKNLNMSLQTYMSYIQNEYLIIQ